METINHIWSVSLWLLISFTSGILLCLAFYWLLTVSMRSELQWVLLVSMSSIVCYWACSVGAVSLALTKLYTDPFSPPPFFSLVQVKDTNMAEYCSCAGQFTETLSLEAFLNQLNTFRNIAR